MLKNAAVLTLATALLLPTATVWAQNEKASGNTAKKGIFSGSPLTWSVDPIINTYVSSLARVYNLNQDQEEYTRQLLTQRVKKFMGDYEQDVRSLFAEYFYLVSNGESPTPEMAKDLAKRGGPLVEAMKKEIIDGNMKWREILDEKQRKQHDRDLEMMDKQFRQIEETFDRWSQGKVSPSDLGATTVPKPVVPKLIEDMWELKVNSFIREYNLDAGQQQTARSILRELRAEADRYREKRKEEFARMDAKFKEVYQGPAKTDPEEQKKAAEAVRKLTEEKNQLEQPIRVELWNQLLARLDRIPTDDQRRVRNERQEKLNAKYVAYRRSATMPADTRPGSSSQPAKTHPAVQATAEK